MLSTALILFLAPQQLPEGLPDFSRAGCSDVGQNVSELTVSAVDHGAIPDDGASDTAAIQAALDAVSAAGGGVVTLPAGRFVVDAPLAIQASHVVLRGAGSDQTVFDCPNALADVRGASPSWSWSGGFIECGPKGRGRKGSKPITEPIARGSTEIRLAAGDTFAPPPGTWLELLWHNDAGADTLLDHVHGGVVPAAELGEEMKTRKAALLRQWLRVVSVTGGDDAPTSVTVHAPLRFELRPAWRPTLAQSPHLRGCGIEGIAFEFPETEYPGHLKERGYNAIQLRNLVQSWVRDIRTVHADSGINVSRSGFVTVDGVVLRGRYMHHPLTVGQSSDCLVTNWRIEAPHRHGTTLTWGANGNVFSKGYGRDLAMDCHRAAPTTNLHTDIVIDMSERAPSPFRSGGSRPRGTHAARDNVYWNIELRFPAASDTPYRIGGLDEWPCGVFVGWRGNRPIALRTSEARGHRVLDHGATPAIGDLHAFQRSQRRDAR